MLRAIYNEFPFNLIRIDGGDADNAVPTGARAQALFSTKISCEEIEAAASAAAEAMKQEYSVTDPGMKWDFEWAEEGVVKAASKKNTDNLLMYLTAMPNGITHMSHVIAGMPQTSLNLGIVRTEGDTVRLELMVRSGVNSQADYLADRLVCITKGFGGKPEVRTSYPAWEYRDDSPLRDLSVSTYKKLYGKEPKVEVIHAGLECGILAGKLEGLDCLSAGPDLENVHTVRERMKISSVENVWTFVLALLKEAAL
jgi:dipeptidase D